MAGVHALRDPGERLDRSDRSRARRVRSRTVLWGSEDGFNYRRTLTAPDGSWFTAAVRHYDRWYVYGTTTTAGAISSMHGWVASVACATGQTCSDMKL